MYHCFIQYSFNWALNWDLNKMITISQTIFSNSFYETCSYFIYISQNFPPKGPINNKPASARVMAWHWIDSPDIHHFEQKRTCHQEFNHPEMTQYIGNPNYSEAADVVTLLEHDASKSPTSFRQHLHYCKMISGWKYFVKKRRQSNSRGPFY